MEVDVVIVGAGPAGCAAAIVLAEAGARVVMLGRTPRAVNRGEDLSPAGPGLLNHLGLWERFQSDDHLPCPAQVSVWGDATPKWHDFIRDPRGHGYHVDRVRLESSLRERAILAGAKQFEAETVRAGQDRIGWSFLTKGNGETLHSSYVIDATGRISSFARRQGARRKEAWRQVALVGWVTPSRPIEESHSLVESVPEGFWYSAPMPGGRFAVALFTESTLVGDCTAGLPQILARASHTADRLARHGGQLAAPLRPVDAGSARLDCCYGPGWIAAGDAALCYDPVSAHGLTLALRTGIDAAHALLADQTGDAMAFHQYQVRLDRSFSIQCREALRTYASERRWPEAVFWKKRHALWMDDTFPDRARIGVAGNRVGMAGHVSL